MKLQHWSCINALKNKGRYVLAQIREAFIDAILVSRPTSAPVQRLISNVSSSPTSHTPTE